MKIKCPRCGGLSYRLRRSDFPIGEHRCCEGCGHKFFYQQPAGRAIEELLEPATAPLQAVMEHIARTPTGAFDREITLVQLKRQDESHGGG